MNHHRTILERRLQEQAGGWLDVETRLLHFALINYAVPRERLERHIPTDRFEIPEFRLGGTAYAMLSAVPFYDVDFHFAHLAPFLKFGFGQTNHRAYIIDRQTGEHCVWFFGTTLGSPTVQIARSLWKIPWHFARYTMACRYNRQAQRYDSYRYTIESDWCAARIDLEDSGEPVGLLEGFSSIDEMQLILTHPIAGYFYRLDGELGSYSVWHKEIFATRATARDLYFSLYEDLGLLSRAEMQRPHSIFICPEVEFKVFLPPKVVR